MKNWRRLTVVMVLTGFCVLESGCALKNETPVPETKPEAASGAEEKQAALFWEDRLSGIGFAYPEGFELSRKADSLVLADLKRSEGGLTVLLNSDFEASDSAEVYEGTRGIREQLNWKLGGETWETALYDGAETLVVERIQGVEVLAESSWIYLRGRQDFIRADSLFFYRSLAGRATAVGCVFKPGVSEETRYYFEDCARQIVASLKILTYQGGRQLDMPDDIIFEARTLSTGRAAVPAGWQDFELARGACCAKAPPFAGDKLGGMTLLNFSSETLDAEPGFENRRFLQDFNQIIGSAALQNPESAFLKRACFFQKRRSAREINGHTWIFLEGYFDFEDVASLGIPLSKREAAVAFTKMDDGRTAVFIFLWKEGQARDAMAVCDVVLGSVQ